MGEDMKNRSGPPRLPVNLWTNEIVTLRISVQRGAVGGGEQRRVEATPKLQEPR